MNKREAFNDLRSGPGLVGSLKGSCSVLRDLRLFVTMSLQDYRRPLCVPHPGFALDLALTSTGKVQTDGAAL